MEWSRSQTRRMEFNPEYIDLTTLLRPVVELVKSAADKKSIDIQLNFSPNFIVHADKEMLRTVMRNLISNAVKFTEQNGEIKINAEEKNGFAVLSVTDNGIGITKQNLENLFRIDTSFSTPGTVNEKGTGLGLILCKEFIDKHQGKIWVESEPGKGSRFFVSLPGK